ncbi:MULTISPECIES: TonB-dependent receptor [unclassified Pseudomonas]|uniref:TonB-dependent receptor domain-containing protein n=1 Tax=unclassified Pseudomonas TaxID=196821 RepID=UPI00244BACE8|nr:MULTISPECIES: TonB-dependent receptor [unclassified Pseudomonas]MDH0897148.1 TonB-dependent receptor [Pseudomonas sp. GD03875]MDH1067404.1 TonB-dependent receptor [Pseudomonas sp. GD03985]
MHHVNRSHRFRPLALALATAALPTLTLAEDTAEGLSLNDIVVTASGYEQQLIEAPASITVIGKEQLEGKYYRDVTDALQDIPGVSIEGGAGGKLESTSINIRGLGEQYTLFMVNGKPLGASGEAYYNGFGSATQFGWLPPMSAIERIEVIRGPMSSLYGSSALAGVINIITKKATAREWSGTVSYDRLLHEDGDAGSANQARYYLSGPLVQEHLALSVYGSRHHRDEDEIVGGYPEKTAIDNTVLLDIVVNDMHSFQLEAGRNESDNERTEKSGAAGDMDNVRTHYGITHDLDWGDNIRTTTFATTAKEEIENGSSESTYSNDLINSKTVIPLERHTITVGGEYKWETIEHDQGRFYGADMELERWQRALFVEDEYYLTDAFSLTAGLRYDENEHYGEEIIPRLYGVYRFSDEWVLKGGVSGGYKAPSLKQADSSIVENAGRGRSYDMGNSDLKPESSINYELGLMWDAVNGIRSGATVFFTEFEDKIDKRLYCTSPASAPTCTVNGIAPRQTINQYVNQDAAELSGVELFFNMPLGERVDLKTNYTFSDSEITESEASPDDIGKPFNNLPKHMFNVGLDWRATDSLNLWTKARYKSETVSDEDLEQRPAYTLVDLGGLYRVNKHLDVYAGLYNVFDKDISSEDYGKTLDGRRLNVGVSLSF